MKKIFSFFIVLNFSVIAFAGVKIHQLPKDMASKRYNVHVNGQKADVFHAGMNVHFVSFDMDGTEPVEVKVERRSSSNPFFWKGVAQIRPYSKNVKVHTDGRVATFKIEKPGQYILQQSEATSAFDEPSVLIFANTPEQNIPSAEDKNVVYVPAGEHYANFDLKSGQTLYLASGAVVYGSINVFNQENVRVCGRGILLHNGMSSLEEDKGYLSKKNWHAVGMANAKNVEINDIIIVNRARSWTIHTLNTFGFNAENMKIVVTCPENVNGDGIDWCGGGNSVIKNCFIRSADDCFAFFTPHAAVDMYCHDKKSRAGSVKNITIENCVLWPTLANLFRMGFHYQDLQTENITLRNSDVIKIGHGYWMAYWAFFCSIAPSHTGNFHHKNYLIENLTVESDAAIFGFNNNRAIYENFTLRNVKIMGNPRPSRLAGISRNIKLENVSFKGQNYTIDNLPMEADSIYKK